MQEKKKWYWEQKQHQQVIVVPTSTIVHPYLDIFLVKDAHDIPDVFAIEWYQTTLYTRVLIARRLAHGAP